MSEAPAVNPSEQELKGAVPPQPARAAPAAYVASQSTLRQILADRKGLVIFVACIVILAITGFVQFIIIQMPVSVSYVPRAETVQLT